MVGKYPYIEKIPISIKPIKKLHRKIMKKNQRLSNQIEFYFHEKWTELKSYMTRIK